MEKYAVVVFSFVFSVTTLSGCMHQQSKGKTSRSPQVGAESDDKKKESRSDVVLEDTEDTDIDSDSDLDEPSDEEQQEPEQTQCYEAEKEICDIEHEIWTLTNQLRAERGLSPLTLSREMSWVSRKWSDQMGSSGFISHLGFPGQRQRDYQSEFGASASLSAENVAMTYSGATNVGRDFYNMWRNSAGHRANMLGNHRSIGIGVSRNSRGGWYATQIFGR